MLITVLVLCHSSSDKYGKTMSVSFLLINISPETVGTRV